MEEQEKVSAHNYEAYYNEYRDKYNYTVEKYGEIEAELNKEREIRKILEAQMEVVRLIFGGVHR